MTTTIHTINRLCEACNGEFHRTSPEEVAQVLADACYVIATHPGKMARYDGPVYTQAHDALRAAVTVAYGEELTDDILEIMIDCGEPLAYCADRARERAADHQARQLGEQRHLLLAGHRADREDFLWRLADALAAAAPAENGFRAHVLAASEGQPGMPADVFYGILSGDRRCGCGNDHPDVRSPSFLAAMSLLYGVELPDADALMTDPA